MIIYQYVTEPRKSLEYYLEKEKHHELSEGEKKHLAMLKNYFKNHDDERRNDFRLPGPKPVSERIYTMFKDFSDRGRELLWRLEEEPRTDHPQEEQTICGCGLESDATARTIREIEALFHHFLEGCRRLVPMDSEKPGSLRNQDMFHQSYKNPESNHRGESAPWRLSQNFEAHRKPSPISEGPES